MHATHAVLARTTNSFILFIGRVHKRPKGRRVVFCKLLAARHDGKLVWKGLWKKTSMRGPGERYGMAHNPSSNETRKGKNNRTMDGHTRDALHHIYFKIRRTSHKNTSITIKNKSNGIAEQLLIPPHINLAHPPPPHPHRKHNHKAYTLPISRLSRPSENRAFPDNTFPARR